MELKMKTFYSIVETDRYGENPDEDYLNLPKMRRKSAQAICNEINRVMRAENGGKPYRFRFKVVKNDYVLK